MNDFNCKQEWHPLCDAEMLGLCAFELHGLLLQQLIVMC